ncbi:unnamed protein product [Blepharisma stoltei]|uniref:Uncharacterized protein n=1 Tax=Blepharisma stoltei TaxID=1481888 RepID=A0AAU9ILY2_9CILI|nr:unnamed protein product [Blepharisma stoltei]
MNTKLLEYFAKNNVKNLYVLHKANQKKKGIYSLTKPFIEPEEMVTSFFTKPKIQKTEEEEFVEEFIKVNDDISKNTVNHNKDSFDSSFDIK